MNVPPLQPHVLMLIPQLIFFGGEAGGEAVEPLGGWGYNKQKQATEGENLKVTIRPFILA